MAIFSTPRRAPGPEKSAPRGAKARIPAGFSASPAALAAGLVLGLAPGLVPGPAAAQQIIVLGNAGAGCYQHAKAGDSTPQALDDCTRALQSGLPTARDIAATYVNRAIVRIYREDYEGALADVETSFRYRDFAEAHATRGVADFYLGRYDESVEEATAALSRDDLDEPAKVYFNRAVAYEAMNRIDDAYYDYKRASEAAPDWDAPRQELTRFSVVPDTAPGPTAPAGTPVDAGPARPGT